MGDAAVGGDLEPAFAIEASARAFEELGGFGLGEDEVGGDAFGECARAESELTGEFDLVVSDHVDPGAVHADVDDHCGTISEEGAASAEDVASDAEDGVGFGFGGDGVETHFRGEGGVAIHELGGVGGDEELVALGVEIADADVPLAVFVEDFAEVVFGGFGAVFGGDAVEVDPALDGKGRRQGDADVCALESEAGEFGFEVLEDAVIGFDPVPSDGGFEGDFDGPCEDGGPPVAYNRCGLDGVRPEVESDESVVLVQAATSNRGE